MFSALVSKDKSLPAQQSAAVCCLFLSLIAGGLGLIAMVSSEINSNAVFPSMINLLVPIGLKGIVISGVVAIICFG